jgi:hypothetical protein
MTAEELHSQVERALAEFREYEGFVNQLEALRQSLSAGKLDVSVLLQTQIAIPGRLQPHRGVIPADDSLKQTRLLINELNHLVKAERKKGAGKGTSG